jgi:crotonobetainyl-CoA:carnitine CoA-transferase CaiB-like acyl-CoA transferase
VAFCAQVLLRPELATDDRFATGAARLANRPALHAEIDLAFAELTTAEIVERLTAARIANARRREVADVLDHPQLHARDRWTDVGSEAGPVRSLRPPLEPARLGSIPALGEHTAAIRRWLDG